MSDQENVGGDQEVGAGGGETPSKDARMFAMLAHISGIVLFVVGPLIFWLIKREEEPFVDDQGKEALNFQITILIGYVISFVLSFVFCIGMITAPLVWLVSVIFCILAGVEANKGNKYRYPFAIRLIN